MKKKLLLIPKFKDEDSERDFWAKADTSKYFDYSKAQKAIFPNLKPSTVAISLRLPQYLLAQIRKIANFRDMPYQSLMKNFLTEKVNETTRTQKFAYAG